MDYLQFDIFGNEVEPKEPEKPSRKFKTMQEQFGCTEGKVCNMCKHIFRGEHHNHTYYKCSLWRISHCTATDIRLKDKACGKYEED